MKRILCAVDLSEASDEALRQSHVIAASSGALLAVCHVVPDLHLVHRMLPARYGDAEPDSSGTNRDTRGTLVDRIRAVTGRAPGDVDVFVDTGESYAAIVNRAEAWKADLVVAASHGLTGLRRMLLGGVVSQLVRHAHCTVLVARAPEGRGVVLAATDLSDASFPALEAAHREAVRRSCELVVVHVVDLAPASMWGLGLASLSYYYVPSAETLADVKARVQARIETVLADLGAVARLVIADGDAATCILREADACGAELVVVGTRGRTGIARIAVGSVAEKVIIHAACSTLAVRLVTSL